VPTSADGSVFALGWPGRADLALPAHPSLSGLRPDPGGLGSHRAHFVVQQSVWVLTDVAEVAAGELLTEVMTDDTGALGALGVRAGFTELSVVPGWVSPQADPASPELSVLTV